MESEVISAPIDTPPLRPKAKYVGRPSAGRISFANQLYKSC